MDTNRYNSECGHGNAAKLEPVPGQPGRVQAWARKCAVCNGRPASLSPKGGGSEATRCL